MSYLAMLAREVGASERTLRRAVAQGTLRGTWVTPRSLRLAPAEAGYIRRSWGLVAALRSALRTEPNVRFALLFGSAARGTDGPQSDVDILVELRDSGLDEVLDLEIKLTETLGRPVDLTLLDDAESEPSLLADTLREGRVLVDRVERRSELEGREEALRASGREQEARRKRDALAAVDRMLVA